MSFGSLPMMSQQLKKRSFVVKAKSIKTSTRESFEKQLEDISEFNSYIDK